MVIDKFVGKQELKDKWNNLLRANGYLDAYKLHYGNDNPNSTNVKSAYRPEHVGSYMAKYMTKRRKVNEDGKARLWGSSENLSSLSNFSHYWQPAMYKHMEDMVSRGYVKKVVYEHGCCYYGIGRSIYNIVPENIAALKRSHCSMHMYRYKCSETYEERQVRLLGQEN